MTGPLQRVRGIVVGGGVIVRCRSWRLQPAELGHGSGHAPGRRASGGVALFTPARHSSSAVLGTGSGRHVDVGGAGGSAVGLVVVDGARHLHPGHAVDRRVVHLA